MRKEYKALGCLISLVFSLPALAQVPAEPSSIGEGTHLYLRCNSTSWGVDEVSRLKTGELDFVRELSFEVKENWMTEAGDDCVITETPALNAWGPWQNYYGGQISYLSVPESSRLRLQANPNDNVTFKLRFPALGRYRFMLNTRDAYFSIRKEAPAQSGEVDWTLPGAMQSDQHGRFFLAHYQPQNSFSLVDVDSGLPVWSYKAESFVSFYGNCSTRDLAFVTLAGRVVALSIHTGREVWSNDLNGALQENVGYLSCFAGSDEIYLSYGSDRTTIVSLQSRNGKALWSWTAPSYAGIMGVDQGRVFINGYQDNRSILQALNRVDGRELWTLNPTQGYASLSEDGELFLVDGSQLTAIAPDSGRTRWTYSGQNGESIWLSFEQNGLYVHERTRLSAMDKRSGQVLWVYDYSAFAEHYPYTQILKTGVVIVRVNDPNAGSSRQIGLNAWTGRLLWEREEAYFAGYLSEDNQHGTWMIQGKTISALDPWTGTIRWTYSLPSDRPMENIMNVLEQDRSTVYVSYGLVGGKYPPMGVLALDQQSGQLKWKHWLESTISRVGSDASTLILTSLYTGSTKALKK